MIRIALTAGEPAGIGLDLCLQIAQQAWDVDLVVFADPEILAQRAKELNLPIKIVRAEGKSQHRAGYLKVQPFHCPETVVAGELNAANSAYVLECLEHACRACQTGEMDALVTAPMQKSIINDAGIAFSGHTEFLAEQTDAEQVVMMLATPDLRVALVTTHLPLKAVSAAITPVLLEQVIRILNADLKTYFNLPKPRIVVCGLNPHAGESGHLGDEEIHIINPVLEALRTEGLDLQGAMPADTVFTSRILAQADAVLSMYHDQGLPVLKHAGFGKAVNITLGLPIIRTSVDHGTALALAGSGQANSSSLEAAIQQACLMVKAKEK